MGVKLVTLRDKEAIASVSIIPSEQEIDNSAQAQEEIAKKDNENKPEPKDDQDEALKELLKRAGADDGDDDDDK